MKIAAPDLRFGDIRTEVDRFTQHLEAGNKSPRTIESYGESVQQMTDFLAAAGMPLTAAGIRREHVESYLADLRKRGRSPATVGLRFRSLRVFFNWLVDEGEVEKSPMARMEAPVVPVHPVPVLSDDQLRAMLRKASTSGFEDRRDSALLRLYADTGARLSELANMTVADVDTKQRVLTVTGKGGARRALPYEAAPGEALGRYMRVRGRHRSADEPWLWLGKRGRLESRGIVQAFKRMASRAGIEGFHVHQMRHTAAHNFLADGGQEGDLMRLMGWTSRTMLQRYAASAADERARAAHHKYSRANKL